MKPKHEHEDIKIPRRYSVDLYWEKFAQDYNQKQKHHNQAKEIAQHMNQGEDPDTESIEKINRDPQLQHELIKLKPEAICFIQNPSFELLRNALARLDCKYNNRGLPALKARIKLLLIQLGLDRFIFSSDPASF